MLPCCSFDMEIQNKLTAVLPKFDDSYSLQEAKGVRSNEKAGNGRDGFLEHEVSCSNESGRGFRT